MPGARLHQYDPAMAERAGRPEGDQVLLALPRFEVCGLTLPIYNERIRSVAGKTAERE
jgi:hypothetical protein